MKKKIVAFALALVMTVLALVGCGAPSMDEIELQEYASFDIDEFIKALGKIEIEDGTFTNNSKDRENFVKESIYNKIVTNLMKTDSKLYKGVVGKNDVVYYSYYLTDEDGNKYYEDKASSGSGYTAIMKNEYSLYFGTLNEGDDKYELNKLIMDAFVNADISDMVYKVNSKANSKITVGDNESVKIVVSFTRSYTDKGENTEDTEEGKKDDVVKYQKASYYELVLDKNSTNPLVQLLLKGNDEYGKTELKVTASGNVVTFKNTVKDDNGTPDDTSDDKNKEVSTSEFKVVEKVTEKVVEDGVEKDVEKDVEYTYSNMKILWYVEDEGNFFKNAENDKYTFEYKTYEDAKGETDADKEKNSFKLTPYGISDVSSSSASVSQISVSGKTLYYHIFPVAYYDVPEFDDAADYAAAILKYYYGNTQNSSTKEYNLLAAEILANAAFKGSDTDIKKLTDELIEIYDAAADSKKWANASEGLKKLEAVILLQKLAASTYVLSDKDKTALPVYAELFELIFTPLADLVLVDNLNNAKVEDITGNKEGESANYKKIVEAFENLREIVELDKISNFYRYVVDEENDKVTFSIFEKLASMQELGKARTKFNDLAKEALKLYDKYIKVPENQAKVAELNAQIKGIEDLGEGATAEQKTELPELKKQRDALQKELDAFTTVEIVSFKTKALEIISTLKTDKEIGVMTLAIEHVTDEKIAEIVATKNDKGTADDTSDDEIASDAIVKELEKSVYDTEEEAYREDIQKKVSKAVYQLILDSVKIKVDKNGNKVYPEDLVEEFRDHIFEEKEHTFYTGNRSGATNEDGTAMSNYKYFKGSLVDFLKDAYKDKYTNKYEADDYMSKMTEEAKEYLDPMIKIYTVAKAFDARGAQKDLAKFLEENIKAGLYNSYYDNDDELSAEENAEAKAEAEEQSKEYIEYLREYAQYFLVTDDAFDLFVDYNYGSMYDDVEKIYGERNLRMAEQLAKLMDYLVGVKGTVVLNTEEHDGHSHSEPEFKQNMKEVPVLDKDGNPTNVYEYYMEFYNPLIKYSFKAKK